MAETHPKLQDRIIALARSVSRNDLAPQLVTKSLLAGEGRLTAGGALAVTTGIFTGRSPKDKYFVRDQLSGDKVWWANTAAMSEAHFDALLADFAEAFRGRDLYVQDLAAGADPRHQMAVTVMSDSAWHALFIRNLLIRPAPTQASVAKSAAGPMPVTILHLPDFRADRKRHGTRSEVVIALNATRNLVIIGGTAYGGEIKKSVFSLFNFHAPLNDVLPMHCSANVGPNGDSALFFGLSGTGKTTLSNDPLRPLIGDDEHGWTRDGIFNLEGGCYAKTVRLSAEAEPEIYAATRSFGTVLENLKLDAALNPLYDDISLTENTRAAYPLETLGSIAPGGRGGIPKTVVFLTADAFGVLPPLARLTPDQAVYHFLSGYTAKVAGTERGVTEPTATFSACFGAPFIALHPMVYGKLLAERLKASGASTWLLNTGWTGGAYGVGKRIDIASTRRLLNAALSGELDQVGLRTDPHFGLGVPVSVPGVAAKLLDPRSSWADPAAYDQAAANLVRLFSDNFVKFGAAAAPIAAASAMMVPVPA